MDIKNNVNIDMSDNSTKERQETAIEYKTSNENIEKTDKTPCENLENIEKTDKTPCENLENIEKADKTPFENLEQIDNKEKEEIEKTDKTPSENLEKIDNKEKEEIEKIDKTPSENLEKIDNNEKEEIENINENDSKGVNEEMKENNGTRLDPSNSNKNFNTNEREINQQKISVPYPVSDQNISTLNLPEKIPNNPVNKNENEKNSSKIIETGKNGKDIQKNEDKNLEKKVSINVKSSVIPSQKTNTRTNSSGPLYIEVKGLLEVLNVQDFAKNIGIKNPTLSGKSENPLSSKRSYSVPAKAVTKNIPKDNNKQSYKNGSLYKISGLPKSSNTQKKPPLLLKNSLKQAHIVKKPTDNKSAIMGKPLDTNKEKSTFRVLPKKNTITDNPKLHPKATIKSNLVPSKVISNEEKEKNNLNKMEKSFIKISPKIMPLLNKEKNAKNKIPLKATAKKTLEDIKNVLEKKNKEIHNSEKSRDTINVPNEEKKSSLLSQKLLTKPKFTMKISSLKKELVKKPKDPVDTKKILLKKPISKLVEQMKPKEKDKKKRIQDKDTQDKKEKSFKDSTEKNDLKKKDDTEIDKSTFEEKKVDIKREEINEEKNVINLGDKDEPEIKKEELKIFDKEPEIEKEDKSSDEKKEFKAEKEDKALDDMKSQEEKENKTLDDKKELEMETDEKKLDDIKESETEEKEKLSDEKELGAEKKENELDDKKESDPEKEVVKNSKEMEKRKADIKKSADLKLNKRVPKKNDNLLSKKHDVKTPLGLKQKAIIKNNSISFKSKMEIDGNSKERKNFKNENTSDLTKSSIHRFLTQKKIASVKKSTDLKKVSLTKNTVKDVEDQKKLGKLVNGSFNPTEMKKDFQDDSQNNKNLSKKVSTTLSKGNISTLKKKILGKSKTEDIHGIRTAKNKTVVSSKSENTENVSEQDKIKKKDKINENGIFNKKTLFKNRKTLSSKLSKLNGKSNTSSIKKFSSFSDGKNKKTILVKNVTSSRGIFENSKINDTLKEVKTVKKLKSKITKKINMSDIINKEDKLIKKIPKKIKVIPSQIKMDKKMRKLKIEILPKGTSNVFKMKDKKVPKKNKVINDDEITNRGRDNELTKFVSGKIKTIKDKGKNNYLTPRIGIHKPKSMNDKLNMSTSNSSVKPTPHSIALSSSTKKLKKNKNKLDPLSIDDALKERLININVSKKILNTNIRDTYSKYIPKLEVPQLSTINKGQTNKKYEEKKRNQSVGNHGLSNLYENPSFNFNRNKSAVSLRDLSLHMKLNPSKELITERVPYKHINNLCDHVTIFKKTEEGRQNSNWIFSKCCTPNNNKSFYERREPTVQNFSSLFNINNKYIPYAYTSEVLENPSNTIKMSNIYESDLFISNVRNKMPLNNNFNTPGFMNNSSFNNYTLRLKKIPTGSRKTTYCNCI
ncbi:conserved Plasmodium protein, unknown function [Plasmodium gallinaceum]|uniref:Uncharacterized protein n=1 Tax=Plasmodium gallinaceum TaxID=5849 RepID=A0A1J1GRU1_PLAGA|nr:conserved Plasmodium protein, unknown function [Plasmodium gallinaceum]CRG94998.1 conserved Plasmodium protein, unknown function [Plasmodium gallinaceum]